MFLADFIFLSNSDTLHTYFYCLTKYNCRFPAENSGKKKQDEETVRDIRVGYGSARDAELNTAADTTDRQEYETHGLPRTSKYSVDKDGVR